MNTETVKRISTPKVFFIENNSDEKKEFVLFGFNEFNGAKNFGNDVDVKIKSLTEFKYQNYFNNTSSRSFKIGKLRIQSATQKNLQKELYFHTNNLSESVYTKKWLNLAFQKDAYQFAGDILDINSDWEITNQTYLSGHIEPRTNIIISIYAISEEKEQLEVPRISGKLSSPIIIQQVKPVKVSKTANKKVATKAKVKIAKK